MTKPLAQHTGDALLDLVVEEGRLVPVIQRLLSPGALGRSTAVHGVERRDERGPFTSMLAVQMRPGRITIV